MNGMNDNPLLLIKVRSAYKKLQQFAWTIRQIEDELPYENSTSNKSLLREYLKMIPELRDIYKELATLKKEDVEQKDRNTIRRTR